MRKGTLAVVGQKALVAVGISYQPYFFLIIINMGKAN